MRKILITVLLLLCPIAVFGQVAKDQFFIIEDFSKMLQSHTSPFASDPSVANDVFNVRANEQFGSLSKRLPYYLYGSCRSFPVESLYRYYKADATKYLLVTSDQYIDLGSDTGGACVNLDSGLTSGKHWDWITYKDLAIGTNGYDRPQKYDGKINVNDNTDGGRTLGEVTADLGAPFAELNTGSNLDASSWYQYKIAYYDGTNFSYSNARSNPIVTGSSVRNITLTGIPLGPTGTTARYLYRTVGNASKAAVLADSSFYCIGTISNNYTLTVDDSMTDTTALLDQSPTWATVSAGIDATPPKGKFIQPHKERIWLANDPSGTSYGKSTVYFSEILNPDYFLSSSNYFLITPDNGDEITFLEDFIGTLTVGKTNSISPIYTGSPNAETTDYWQVAPPKSFIGCVAPYSAQSTPIGIIYLGNYGLFKFDGQSSTLISDSVTKDIKDISQSNYNQVVGKYFKNEYNLAYTSLQSGSSTNNRVLVFDLIRNSYVKDDSNIDSYATFDSGTDFGTLYSGSSTTDGKILAHATSQDSYLTRYESQLNAGTTDSVIIEGTEDSPTMQLGWGVTIDSVSTTIDSTTLAGLIVDRDKTTGYWYSPSIELNATALDKIYWNTDSSATGTITLAVRTGDTTVALSAAAWSSELTNQSGSDISTIAAKKYAQIRAKLSTTNINYSPIMNVQDNYMIKVVYSRLGVLGESVINSLWKSNFINLNSGAPNNPKIIREADIYYEGTSGILNIAIQNLKGDILKNLSIDLSKTYDPTNGYFGDTNNKVFRYNFPIPSGSVSSLVGDQFMISITESGTTPWKINRFVLRYDILEYVPMK